MEDLIHLGDAEFRFITELLYANFGIHLGDQKRTLVAGRLSKRIRLLGMSSFSEYMARLRSEPSELSELVDNLSTNHTYFFREADHFAFLDEKVFAPMASNPAAGLPRVWSAGCASGEEAYTIAMFMRDKFGPRATSGEPSILATDIALPALRIALDGEYPESKLKDLPASMRNGYFERIGPESFRIVPAIKRMVLFKRLNLMSDSFPFREKFDAIFCRNVMIYFDPESRRKLIDSFYRWVVPGGYFFLGHSETIPRLECPFEYVKPAVYRRTEA